MSLIATGELASRKRCDLGHFLGFAATSLKSVAAYRVFHHGSLSARLAPTASIVGLWTTVASEIRFSEEFRVQTDPVGRATSESASRSGRWASTVADRLCADSSYGAGRLAEPSTEEAMPFPNASHTCAGTCCCLKPRKHYRRDRLRPNGSPLYLRRCRSISRHGHSRSRSCRCGHLRCKADPR